MKEKKKISLPIKIFIGMALGIIVGLICTFIKNTTFTGSWLKPIGDIYINLLKFLVVPVVLFSIADGVISLKDLKRVGSVGSKTFVYYIFTTALAVVIGLLLVNFVKNMSVEIFPELPSESITETVVEYNEAQATKSAKTTDDLKAAAEAKKDPVKMVMDLIVSLFPSNMLKPMAEDDMLKVIVIAIFLGAGVLAAGEKGQRIGELINCGQAVIMKIMMMIISFTPIGVFCLMSDVVAKNGPAVLGSLALVILVAYIGYILHIVLVYGLSVRFLSKMTPIKFFKGIAPAMMTDDLLQRNAARQH